MALEKRIYLFKMLPAHLASVGQKKRLKNILWMFDFLQAKLDATNSDDLVADLDLLLDEGLRLVQSAVRMSAQTLDQDRTQLAAQLMGRLGRYTDRYLAIASLLEDAAHGTAYPALLRAFAPS